MYALKQLRRDVDSVNHLDNILNEIMILAKLNHGNLIKMHGKYRTKDFYNIILEYCNGGTLYNFLGKFGKLREPMARSIIKQLTEGLQYLHIEKRIVHRDVKSQNIMLHWDIDHHLFTSLDQYAKALTINPQCLKLKLGDFGFARPIHPQELLMTSVGTPMYMAPEVLTA